MKLALIPPIELLEYTDETFCQLALPYLITSSETYRYVYQMHCDDPHQYVILDNGAAEGLPILAHLLVQMALELGVNELVIPDVLGDADQTMSRAKKFLEIHTPEFFQSDIKMMFVAQGSTYREFLLSAMWAAGQKEIDTIGLPRHMIETCNDHEARWGLAEYLNDRTNKPVHLLGGAPSVPDEIHQFAPWPRNVRSTDTSSPFNWSYYGLSLQSGGNVSRPDRYFERSADAFNPELVDTNVRLLMEWTGNDV